jgi:hypothetical protein
MSKPTRDIMMSKLEAVYMNSFTGGKSIISSTVKGKNRLLYGKKDPKKNLINWKERDFVMYFASRYRARNEVQYNTVFAVEVPVITSLKKYFESLGLDYRVTIKHMIDWGFDNYDMIQERQKYFTLTSVKTFANEFLQSQIFDSDTKQEEVEYDFVGALDKLFDSKKLLNALRRYGIPIVASYLYYIKDIKVGTIKKNILSLNLSKDDWSKIAKSSIVRSPYRTAMALQDWRDVFSDKVNRFSNEKWWREVDYKGRGLKSYKKLCHLKDQT